MLNYRSYIKLIFANLILILAIPLLTLLPFYFLYSAISALNGEELNNHSYSFVYLYIIYLGFGFFPLAIYGFLINRKFYKRINGNIKKQTLLILGVGLIITVTLYVSAYLEVFKGIHLEGYWLQALIFIFSFVIYGILLHYFIKPLYSISSD